MVASHAHTKRLTNNIHYMNKSTLSCTIAILEYIILHR